MPDTINLTKSPGSEDHEPRVKPITSVLLNGHVVKLPTNTHFKIHGLVLLSAFVREASYSWGGG